jgi:hypothetical protein
VAQIGRHLVEIVAIVEEDGESLKRFYATSVTPSQTGSFDARQSFKPVAANQKGAHKGTAQFVFDSTDATMAVGDQVFLDLNDV